MPRDPTRGVGGRLPALVVAVLALTPLGEAGRNLILPGNSVGTDQLQAQAVTRGKLGDRQVTRDKIALGAVDGAQLRSGAVSADELANGAVSATKLAPLPAAGTARRVDIRRNGEVAVASENRASSSPGVRVIATLAQVLQLDARDYVEVVVTQGSGQPLELVPIGELSPEFQLAYLGPS